LSGRKKNLIVLVATLTICVGMLEGIVRFLDLAPYNVRYWMTNVRGAQNANGISPHYRFLYSTDGLGLRVVPANSQNERSDVNAIYIGASFVFGLGVNDGQTIPAQLATSLRKAQPDHSYNVWNMGVPGIGPQQYRHFAENYIKDLKPDIVFISLANHNDLVGNNPPVLRTQEEIQASVLASRETLKARETSPEESVSGLAIWHSALVRLLYRSFQKIAHGTDWKLHNAHWRGTHNNVVNSTSFDCAAIKEQTRLCHADYASGLRTVQKNIFDHLVSSGKVKAACDCETNPWRVHATILGAGQVVEANFMIPDMRDPVESEVQLQLAFMDGAIKAVRDAGAVPVVTLMPSAFLVEPELFKDIFEGWVDLDTLRTTTELNDFVMEACSRKGWICFDPLKQMRMSAREQDEPLYIPGDGHMTVLGAKLYNSFLFDFIQATPELSSALKLKR